MFKDHVVVLVTFRLYFIIVGDNSYVSTMYYLLLRKYFFKNGG
jgi:hypothetical protein